MKHTAFTIGALLTGSLAAFATVTETMDPARTVSQLTSPAEHFAAAPAKADSQIPNLITDPQGKKVNYIESGEGWFFFLGIMEVQDVFSDMPTDMVYGDDNKVYIRNIIPRFPTDSYVEARQDGDRIILTLPQVVKIEKRDGAIYDYYVDRMELEVDEETREGTYWPSKERDVVYNILPDGTIEMEESDGTWAIGITNNEGLWQGNADWNCRYVPNDFQTVTPPDGLVTEEMQIICNYTGFNVGVGFDGNDVYVRGICEACPNSWIKGTLEGNKVTFENAQYLGEVPTYGMMGFFFGGEAYPDPKFVWGYSLADKLEMEYDPATKTLKTGQAIIINDNPDHLKYMYAYRFPLIHPDAKDHSQVPQNVAPTSFQPYGLSGDCIGFQFYLPNISVDNYILPKDEIYWSLYLNDELYTFEPYLYEGLKKDTYEVPFNCDAEDIENPYEGVIHTIYVRIKDFDKVGFISLHRVPGIEEPFYSELVEFVNPDKSGVEEISLDTPSAERIYDLNGMPVMNPAKGHIYIVDKGTKTIKRVF